MVTVSALNVFRSQAARIGPTVQAILLGLALSALGATGCAADKRVHVGTVYSGELKPNAIVPDFPFRDRKDVLRTFRSLQGEVTVVALPSNPDWVGCEQLKNFVRVIDHTNRARRFIGIVVVGTSGATAHTPTDFCSCEVEGSRVRLTLLNDPHSRVRELYGRYSDGSFYLIDTDARVIERGELCDMIALQNTLDQTIQSIENRETDGR